MGSVSGRRENGFITVRKDVRFAGNTDIGPVIGKKIYIRDSGSAGYDGLTPATAVPTLTAAVALASDWDTIQFLPCDTAVGPTVPYHFIYEISAPVHITQRGLKIFGWNTSGHQWANPMIRCAANTTPAALINVDADSVEIGYLSFYNGYAGSVAINLSYSSATYAPHVHDCYFKGADSGYVGITTGAASYDCVSAIIERCYFAQQAHSGIEWYAGAGAMIRDCDFIVPAGCNGIDLLQAAAGKLWSFIIGNRFIAQSNTTSYGVKFTATPSDGYLMITGNQFINFADQAHCLPDNDGLCGLNYYNATAMTVTKN